MFKRNIKSWVTMLILILVAVIANTMEAFLLKENVELRTFMQAVKGLYVWLVMPLYCTWIVYSICKKELENTKLARIAFKIAVVLLFLIIIVIAGFRGIYYMFSTENKQEKSLGNGILEITEVNWDTTKTYYDEEVFFFFRKPFSGYTHNEIIQKIYDRYGEEVEFIKEDGDYYQFSNKIISPVSEVISFQVKKDYLLEDNFEEEVEYFLGKSFFEKKNRTVSWIETDSAVGVDYMPVIGCGGRGDLEFFCNDVTELMEYYLQNKYLKNNPMVLNKIGVSLKGEQTAFYIGDMLENFDQTEFYNFLYKNMEDWMNNQYENNLAIEDDMLVEKETEEIVENKEITQERIDYYLSVEPACIFTTEEGLEYRLLAVDRALGSSFYSMIATNDGGKTCAFVNEDPFNGSGGEARWLTFIDSKIGFAGLSYSGGSLGMMFRTEDGGESFTYIEYPSPEIELPDGTYYNPFVMPERVYEENGTYYLDAGQGPNGDYNGGDTKCHGLYKSDDKGKSWTYVKEIIMNQD